MIIDDHSISWYFLHAFVISTFQQCNASATSASSPPPTDLDKCAGTTAMARAATPPATALLKSSRSPRTDSEASRPQGGWDPMGSPEHSTETGPFSEKQSMLRVFLGVYQVHDPSVPWCGLSGLRRRKKQLQTSTETDCQWKVPFICNGLKSTSPKHQYPHNGSGYQLGRSPKQKHLEGSSATPLFPQTPRCGSFNRQGTMLACSNRRGSNPRSYRLLAGGAREKLQWSASPDRLSWWIRPWNAEKNWHHKVHTQLINIYIYYII